MNARHDVRAVARQFQVHGQFSHAEPYGKGHINDTYRMVFDQAGTLVPYLLQRINHQVFKHPVAVMENIERVTAHLGRKLAGEAALSRHKLTLISTRDGSFFHRDAEGNFWRAYLFIEKALTYETAQSPAHAFEAGKAFGHFQKLLVDLPSPRLHDTIPDFHDTPKRFVALERAISGDKANRAALAKAEIAFALRRKPMTGILLAAGLPERVTHNDTKLNNILFDSTTGAGICVIDLDTVMPGLALSDFGDLVRTGTSPAEEDERDLSKVRMQFSMFEALVRGYLTHAGDFLTKAERQFLAFAGKLVTFEIGLRFLTDFLEGDPYFKVQRAAHNLDRCRVQFRLVESIEQQEEQMNKFVENQ